jgi:serine/threonine-protein kinase RsbW
MAGVLDGVERELRIPPQPARLKDARDFMDSVLSHAQVDDATSFQLKLAANEAVANAIEHGAPCEDGTIQLRAACGDEGVEFSVRDCGGDFVAPAEGPQALAERGRGLSFMAAFVDEVELRPDDGATLIRLVKRLERPAA